MFTHLTDLGGFTLIQIALLYGASSVGLRVADLLIGSVEQIGLHVRTGPARPDADPAGAAAGAGLRRQLLAPPLRPDRPGRDRLRLGLLRRRLDPVAGPGGGAHGRQLGRDLLRALRRLLLRAVLDHRLHRVRQRVHLRRQHDHPVPHVHLPEGAHQEPHLPAADRVRELVPLPLPARHRRPVRPAVVAAVLLAGRRGRRAGGGRCSPGGPASVTTPRPGADMVSTGSTHDGVGSTHDEAGSTHDEAGS